MPGEGILSTFSLPLAVLKFLGGKLFATMFYIFIIKGTKRTLILSSKKQTNHKLIIIKGKKTRILSKELTNNKLSKEPSEPGRILSKGPSEPGRIILSKGPSEPGRILSKETSEPLYYQRNQVNQN